MADTLTLEAYTDARPCPRVGVTIANLHATNPSRITLWRTANGVREWVRGCRNRVVTGSEFVWDYEVPLGREVTYELEVLQGDVIPTDNRPITALDVSAGWIQDPLQPSNSVEVSGGDPRKGAPELLPTAFKKLTRSMAHNIVPILGSAYPAALGGQRLAAAGVDFSVMTSTAEYTTLLRHILETAYPVLLRPLPEWGPLPPLCYLAAGDPEELPINHALGGSLTRWNLEGDLVASPGLSIVVPVWTYADIDALWSSYQEAQLAAQNIGASYIEEIRNPTFGGA